MAKMYLENGVVPFGLGNSWIADRISFDPKVNQRFNLEKLTDFDDFSNQDFLAIVTNIRFEYCGFIKSLEEYKFELRKETLSQANEDQITQVLQNSSIKNLTLLKNNDKRQGQMVNYNNMLEYCIYDTLNLPQNNNAFLAMEKIFKQIVITTRLEHRLRLGFYEAKDEKYKKVLPTGMYFDGAMSINLNYFAELYIGNPEQFISEFVKTVLHEIAHYYQDSFDPDVHSKNFTNIMELVSSFTLKHIYK